MSIHKQLINGFELLNNNKFKDALIIAHSVLSRKYNLDALMLAGICTFKLKDYTQSEIFFSKLYNERRQNQVTLVYYLEILIKLDKIKQGIKIFCQITDKSPTLLMLGISLYELNGEFTKAIKQAKNIPVGLNKYEILAWNYERVNKLKKAKKTANKGLLIDQNNFKCNITRTKLYLRSHQSKKALKQLKNIDKQQLSKINLSIYYSLYAQILEQQQKYNQAFKAYTESNNILKTTTNFTQLKGHSFYTLEKVNTIKKYFNNIPHFKNLIEAKTNITFMIGFPRSGTTLLENILKSHTQISTIEEKPTVNKILERFLNSNDSLRTLELINNDEICELQDDYILERNEFSTAVSNIIIDKMPLNLIHIGILYRIFPNAKFIISIRDIRDVALSCYFQNFAINDAMALFLDWDKTKSYLKVVMDLCNEIVSNYPIKVHYVQYEKFVKSPIKTTKGIIKFLDLDWQEPIRKYRKLVVGKNINTPSYASVSNKITTSKKNRWKNYQDRF